MNHHDAIVWIKQAQDEGTNDGISALYHAKRGIWHNSYPEVSGYIIPTLIAAGEEDRALRVSRWLITQQLAQGSIPLGFWDSKSAAVFDTGAVLLGWIAAQEVEYDPSTELAIEKAVYWLERCWKGYRWTRVGTEASQPATINVRAIWPLALRDSPIVDELLDYFLERIDPNGFPRMTDDQFPDMPLSHFIVYVARGFFESGLIEPATRIMENLPSVPVARYNSNWEPVTDDICITGVAQASIMFRKLGFRAEAQRGLNYLETLTAPWGSDPIDGKYFSHCQISWCAKFIADAWKEADSH